MNANPSTSDQLLELYQTEWCPASRRVRERLTELGLDYLIHQVSVERDARTTLLAATGVDTIPALLLEDGEAVVGEEAIEAYLDGRFDEPAEAEARPEFCPNLTLFEACKRDRPAS